MHKVRTPIFPLYSHVRHLLRILPGIRKSDLSGLISDVLDQTGTPQNPVDWSDPDVWVDERLAGSSALLARRIWEESGKALNPRYTRGPYFFVNGFDLLQPDAAGCFTLTERGRAFLEGDEDVVRELDDLEGIVELLSILATKTSAMRGDLIPEWTEFLSEYSRFGTASTIKDTLRRRLVNLAERGLVERDGNSYLITEKGVDYAASFTGTVDPKRDVVRAINAYNHGQQGALRDVLAAMPPYQFEHLVRDLLEAMGYEDVQVTKQSGDKGVDVVATVQFGITTVTEVVQVKRQKSSIHAAEEDQRMMGRDPDGTTAPGGSRSGFDYLLANDSVPGFMKIGSTDRHPTLRAQEALGIDRGSDCREFFEMLSPWAGVGADDRAVARIDHRVVHGSPLASVRIAERP